MSEELPELDFHPEDGVRSLEEMVAAFLGALWEHWFYPQDDYITGAMRAGHWLGRVYPAGPVSRAPYWPIRPRIVEELHFAREVAAGRRPGWAGPLVDQDFARGVVAMLEYVIGLSDEVPVPMVHAGELPPIMEKINPEVWARYQAQQRRQSDAA